MTDTSTQPLSALYERAWNKLFDKKPKCIQNSIIEEPHGREATDLAHEVAKLAEGWDYDDNNCPF